MGSRTQDMACKPPGVVLLLCITLGTAVAIRSDSEPDVTSLDAGDSTEAGPLANLTPEQVGEYHKLLSAVKEKDHKIERLTTSNQLRESSGRRGRGGGGFVAVIPPSCTNRAGNDEESEEDEDLLLGEDNSKGFSTAAASSMAVRSVVAVAEAQIAELAARSQLSKDVIALNKLKDDVKVAEKKIAQDEKHLSETCEKSNTFRDEEKKAKVTNAPTRAPTRTTRSLTHQPEHQPKHQLRHQPKH